MDRPFFDRLRRDGIIQTERPLIQALSGGVSSEIYRVQEEGRNFVVKRALPKLKVKDDWQADISRNRYEAEFFCYIGKFLPQSVPKILVKGEDYFVMEYLDGFRDWKSLLMESSFNVTHAKDAGALLGKIHRHTFADTLVASRFDTRANFVQLRVSPYLDFIAKKHPAIAKVILKEARRLALDKQCLIHGDFSPKNILISRDRLVLVDAEVAYFGDPAFDYGFLLCHLLLKALLHAPYHEGLSVLCSAFGKAYFEQGISAIPAFDDLELRVARLLPMLLLARVDGKSQVEYLSKDKQAFTREFSLKYLKEEIFDLNVLINSWFQALE